MKFKIDAAIIAKFPKTRIGYVVAEITNPPTNPYVQELKSALASTFLSKHNLTKETSLSHPALAIWQEILQGQGVKPKEYPASVTALVKRVTAGKGIWNISSVVDLYNCHSVLGIVPMGGYNMESVRGDITLRFGKPGESFLALGAQTPVAVTDAHVVYADDTQVMCWLWNHKDCAATMITPDTTKAVFFMDCAKSDSMPPLEATLAAFCNDLNAIGCNVLDAGIADANRPEVEFEEKKTLTSANPAILPMFATEKTASQSSESLVKHSEQRVEDDRLGIRDPRLASDEQISAIRRALSHR